jgi:branched-chain amino acid transport system permease protein
MLLNSMKASLIRLGPSVVMLLFLMVAPLVFDRVAVSLLCQILIYGLLAMSLDLIFGYTGMWSFCHAAIFGVAGYTVGLLVKFYTIKSFWLLAPAGLCMAVLASLIFGLITLRARTVYFLLITFALGQLIYSLTIKLNKVTGGSDGLPDIPYPDLGFGFSFTPTRMYYFVLIIFVVSALILYRITKSPFGQSLNGIRDSEIRMRTLGYKVWLHRYIAFVISGFFAGLAGVMYAHFSGLMTPDNTGFGASGMVMIMIIIGGSGTLWGALIGSFVIFLLEFYVSGFSTDRWPIVLGACFVVAVMFTRRGIFPLLEKQWKRMTRS